MCAKVVKELIISVFPNRDGIDCYLVVVYVLLYSVGQYQ